MRTVSSRGRFAEHHAGFERQLFVRAHGHIVARHDAARREQIHQRGDNPILGRIHALVERLDDQIVAVAVHDQGREAVAFAVHHAVRIGVAHDVAAILVGFRDAPRKKFRPDFLHLAATATADRFARWSCSAPCRAGARVDRSP